MTAQEFLIKFASITITSILSTDSHIFILPMVRLGKGIVPPPFYKILGGLGRKWE